jgi:ribonuclease T1
MRRKRGSLLAVFPALIAVFIAIWLQRSTNPTAPTQAPGAQPSATTSATPAQPRIPPAAPPTAQPQDEEASPLAALPADQRRAVAATLALIERGGPYPHAKDGSVFSNREGRLPRQPRGYYREYTVDTPGASNRGARRIVRGTNGETYYTSDHYESFVRIDEERGQ